MDEDVREASESGDHEDILATAVKRYSVADTAFFNIYTEALDDLRNVAGDQWPKAVLEEREGRPCLTINLLWKHIKSIIGDQKQNRPVIKVFPTGGAASVEKADVLREIIRHIEYDSTADDVYDLGFQQAASSSIGFWRVLTEYQSPKSFNRKLVIRKIHNHLDVLFDPSAKDPCWSDAKYAFVSEYIKEEQFKDEYPDANSGGIGGTLTDDSTTGGWFKDGLVRVTEYYYKKEIDRTLYLVDDGMSQYVLEKGEKNEAFPDGVTKRKLEDEGYEILEEREAEDHELYWCKISGGRILEGPIKQDGKSIPIVPVMGDEMNINGIRKLFSMIRFAKDPQRMYNYWRSAHTEVVALQPKAPLMLTTRQLGPYKWMYDTLGTESHQYLLYESDPMAGSAMPKRLETPQGSSGAFSETQQAKQEVMETIGQYEASLGQQSNERSGKALLMRQRSADKALFSFYDNHSRAIAYTGKLIVERVPFVYDTTQTLKILGEDGTAVRELPLNTPGYDEMGNPVLINDMSDMGEYDVKLASGPGYETKRAETVDLLIKMLQFAPEFGPQIIQKVANNIDGPGAAELAEEMKQIQAQQQQQPQGAGAGAGAAPSPQQQSLPMG